MRPVKWVKMPNYSNYPNYPKWGNVIRLLVIISARKAWGRCLVIDVRLPLTHHEHTSRDSQSRVFQTRAKSRKTETHGRSVSACTRFPKQTSRKLGNMI